MNKNKETMEEWRIIEGYPNYNVSNEGRVMNIRLNRILSGTLNSGGYVIVGLDNKKIRVHRLVAKAFLDNWDETLQVNHIDLDKTNNSVNNLEMCTSSENNLHAYELLGKRKSKIKRIDQFDKDGNYITTFKSIADAARSFPDKLFVAAQSNISKCCNGKSKSAYGYIFNYTKE